MSRIQILELPTQVVGEYAQTPFAIVIDQVETESVESYAGDVLRATSEQIDTDAIAQATGAVGVIVHTGTLDVA